MLSFTHRGLLLSLVQGSGPKISPAGGSVDLVLVRTMLPHVKKAAS